MSFKCPPILAEAIDAETRLLAKENNIIENFVEHYCIRRRAELGDDSTLNVKKYFPKEGRD